MPTGFVRGTSYKLKGFRVKVKFWGCRGSIPVPDSRMIKYGGNTTCVEVNMADNIFIIDAGTGIRKLGEDLLKRKIFNFKLFLTHSHWDHIQGFPFFAPIYSEKSRISILGCTHSYKQVKEILSNQMSYEFFPVSFLDLKSKIAFEEVCESEYSFDDYTLRLIPANHPLFTVGIRLEWKGKAFVFITDNELKRKQPTTLWHEFVAFCRGADYLVHDAQFTEKEYLKRLGWGHSTFEQALALAEESGVKNLGFFHHDPSRKDYDLQRLEKKYQDKVKAKGFKFKVFMVKEKQMIEI
jgi:phosphoribosyl 1,2-cyclic phosphodiesterase